MNAKFNSKIKFLLALLLIGLLFSHHAIPSLSYVNANSIYDMPAQSTVETPPGQTSYILLTNDPIYIPKGKEAVTVYTQGIQGFDNIMAKGTQFEFVVSVEDNSTSFLQLDMQLSFDILNENQIRNVTYGETLIGINFPIIKILPNQTERIVLEFNAESEWAGGFYFGLIPNRPNTEYPNSRGDILPNSTIFVKTTVNVLYNPQEVRNQFLGIAVSIIAIVTLGYFIYNRYYKDNSQ